MWTWVLLWQHSTGRKKELKKKNACHLQFISSCHLENSGLPMEAVNNLIPPFSFRSYVAKGKGLHFHFILASELVRSDFLKLLRPLEDTQERNSRWTYCS